MKTRTAFFGVLGGAVLIAAATVAFVRVTGASPAEPAASQVSAAQARAIGARWRAEKSQEQARAYAQALIGAGLYDELLTEIAERGLFADDAVASGMFRAEANLRQGRFDEAIEAARTGDNPYFAYARARAVYALTADHGAVAADLSAALRGPPALAGDAWLFRARLALDANDFDSAAAAARRAAEVGVAPSRVDLFEIEKSVRAGEIGAAARLLEARGKDRRAPIAAEDFRLAAMAALRSGDAAAAVRLIDRARGAAGDDRARLLASLSKHLAGDNAQAWSLAASHLAAAPVDWVALDIGAAIARDMGRAKDEGDLLARLEKLRPALAAIRMMRAGSITDDAAFDALTGKDGDLSAVGAAAFLLGPGAVVRGLEEGQDQELAYVDAATALRGDDRARLRRLATKMLNEKSPPLGLALAGALFAKLEDTESAARAFGLAAASAPDFLAPVLLNADLHARSGDRDGAAAILREFLARHDDNDRARLILARLEAENGDLKSAAENFAKIPPQAIFGDETLAALYGAAAKAAGGAAQVKMIETARASASTPRIQGVSLAATGDNEGAAAALRRAMLAGLGDDDLAGLYQEVMTSLGRADEAGSLLAEIRRRRNPAANSPDAGAGIAEARKIADFEVNIRQ